MVRFTHRVLLPVYLSTRMQMPTAEYRVYVSNGTLVAEIEQYCDKHGLTESEAFKEAMRRELQREVNA